MTVPPGLLAVPAAAPSISGAAARSYGFQAACSWGGLLVLLGCAAPWIGLPLAVVWLLGGAVAALPWLGRAPAEALNVLAWLYLGLLGTIVPATLAPSAYFVGFALVVGGSLALTLTGAWVGIAAGLIHAPLAEWRVELGRVLTIAIVPAGPLAGLGAAVSSGLLRGRGVSLAPALGLWIPPELAGALTGAGVCVLGALIVRRGCAEEPIA